MPIRRAAATPTQEKAPSAAAEKEQEASSEESPPADKEQAAASAAPAEGEASGDGETQGKAEKAGDGPLDTKEEPGDGKEMKDGVKHKKSKSKKVKRTIPAWASVTTHKKIPVSNFAGTQNKVENVLVEAIGSSNERSGMSFQSVMKYMLKKYPGMEFHKKKTLIKKSMKKHLEKGTIKQLKGKGLSGTFAIGKALPQSKKGIPKQESLGDALPLIITRLCEPKEASYNLIKKYLEQHFPSLNIENRPDLLKTALVRAVEKGHLEQITGTGARGTFQLKRAAKESQLKGSTLEDAITVAITAMNEPKTCSTTSLRKYLVDSNKDVKENLLVANLRRTLTKCKVLGWMEQITGHGFTGTYQLSFPFYPSPTTLYPDKFKDVPKKTIKQKRFTDSSDEEDEEEEEESEEEESEDEAPVRKRKPNKRPPPKARRPPPTKKPRIVSKSKAGGKGQALAKKSPPKKTVSSGRNPSKKETVSTPKATPVKKGAPSRKSKTPAVKKLSKKGSRKPPSRESSPEPKVEKVMTKSGSRRTKAEESIPEEPKVVKETTKSGSKRPKVEDSSPKEPAPKKQAARGGSKKKAQPSPPKKADLQKNPKSSKQSARKSKRGRY
ncbi:heterochromatin protein 1-binding protein 3 isoform X2 [Poeciliopsis prolifica]|uniref:heterochromatin protein 1-binding protein 3 isoform X2 n=1 Tax=Poeciliopsis prolifica TaxID=188132 RepID=UPI0024133011|nr:heterochromatin protein 1-binding protein 3 isoform X2 [Poeciliopsis prolifica]